MASPVLALLTTSFRSWVSAKGFAMVTVAALFPLFLTGAWLGTHQGDVAATDVTWAPAEFVEGQEVTFTATYTNVGQSPVAGVNATLSVGRVFGNTLSAQATNTTRIESLAPGASTTLQLTWNATAGVVWVLADVDPEDEVGEIEEFNNQRARPLQVAGRLPGPDEGPAAPGNLTGPEGAADEADLAVAVLTAPEGARPGDNLTLRATVTNRGPAAVVDQPVQLRAGRVFEGNLFPSRQAAHNVSLEPGQSTELVLEWPRVPQGTYWFQAYVNATTVRDPDGANNHLAQPFAVNEQLAADAAPPEPPERLTIKDFYVNTLQALQLVIVIPVIALFYAGGVLADDRERGNLVYLLTRPMPRWMIPLSRFAASYAVAAVAVVLGALATFALLFGTPGGDVGFLTTPLLGSLLALFVYGGFFVLLGVLVERPYIVGLAFVLGWELLAGLFVPWVGNLTIRAHVLNALQAWPIDQGVQLVPEGEAGVRALLVLLGAGAAFLAGAAVAMKKRDFLG